LQGGLMVLLSGDLSRGRPDPKTDKSVNWPISNSHMDS
jgi:hypothetical protein